MAVASRRFSSTPAPRPPRTSPAVGSSCSMTYRCARRSSRSATPAPRRCRGRCPAPRPTPTRRAATVDQALDAQGGNVSFSKPVINYVDNYLDLPVGTPVPTGYYDRAHNRWVPARNGLVIGIVAVSSGLAEIDLDGDRLAESPARLLAAGIDEAGAGARSVRSTTPGESLWRVELTDFSAWDYNYPHRPAAGRQAGQGEKATQGFPRRALQPLRLDRRLRRPEPRRAGADLRYRPRAHLPVRSPARLAGGAQHGDPGHRPRRARRAQANRGDG